MALAPIVCEGPCGKIISAATKIVAVDDKPWCIDCSDKREDKGKIILHSDNPCTDVEITMTQCLKLARWTFLYFAKNEPLSIFEKDSSVWRNDVFGKWRVQDSRVVTVSKEGWAFWSFSDGIGWKREGSGSSFDWQSNWTWIDMSWGPNSAKKP